MGFKLAIMGINRVAHRTARLIKAIIVQELLAKHQIVLRNAETLPEQAKNNAIMATNLDAPTAR